MRTVLPLIATALLSLATRVRLVLLMTLPSGVPMLMMPGLRAHVGHKAAAISVVVGAALLGACTPAASAPAATPTTQSVTPTPAASPALQVTPAPSAAAAVSPSPSAQTQAAQRPDAQGARINGMVDNAVAAYRQGKTQDAYDLAAGAYAEGYEDVEDAVAAKGQQALVDDAEQRFKALRDAIQAGKPLAEVEALAARARQSVDQSVEVLK